MAGVGFVQLVLIKDKISVLDMNHNCLSLLLFNCSAQFLDI